MLPNGVSKYLEERWLVDEGAQVDGIVGTLFTQTYTAEWPLTSATLGWRPGAAMPGRPVSGIGSRATIVTARRGTKGSTNTALWTVVSFEADTWTGESNEEASA